MFAWYRTRFLGSLNDQDKQNFIPVGYGHQNLDQFFQLKKNYKCLITSRPH